MLRVSKCVPYFFYFKKLSFLIFRYSYFKAKNCLAYQKLSAYHCLRNRAVGAFNLPMIY
jgi:hypothetical protein